MAIDINSATAIKKIPHRVNAVGNSGTTLDISYNDGEYQTITLDNNCTFTISNPPTECGILRLELTQDGAGSRTVTFPASVKWAGGTAPTLTTTAAAIDLITLITFDSGTSWYGDSILDLQ